MDIWDDEDDQTAQGANAEREWTRISESYTNDGYREGITAGKEEALQEGFDDGFASVGVPLGHQIGRFQGATAALLANMENVVNTLTHDVPQHVSNSDGYAGILAEVRAINQGFKKVNWLDMAPPDLQAEEHNKMHESEMVGRGDDAVQSDQDGMPIDPMDDISSAFSALGTVDSAAQRARRREETIDELQSLLTRLSLAMSSLGLSVPGLILERV